MRWGFLGARNRKKAVESGERIFSDFYFGTGDGIWRRSIRVIFKLLGKGFSTNDSREKSFENGGETESWRIFVVRMGYAYGKKVRTPQKLSNS